MGSSCQYRVTGVNSDSQMDVFRILRLVVLKSTSAAAAAAPLDAVYLPLNYEIFAAELQVRQAAAARPSAREPAEKMRDTFSRVTTYLRNSGIIIIIIIKDIYIAPFRRAPKALCKKKVKC